MKYPGGEHHGKRTTHVLFHELTGKVVGHASAEDGLIDKHDGPKRDGPPQPKASPAHYSDAAKHPGFKAVQAKIAKKEGVSSERAGAILAASSRHASKAAKRANPNLKKVKG